MWHVYELSDPRDNKIRYVGATNNPSRRLAAHEAGKVRSTRDWVAALKQESALPKMTVIRKGGKAAMLKAEAAHRKKLICQGEQILFYGVHCPYCLQVVQSPVSRDPYQNAHPVCVERNLGHQPLEVEIALLWHEWDSAGRPMPSSYAIEFRSELLGDYLCRIEFDELHVPTDMGKSTSDLTGSERQGRSALEEASDGETP